MIERVWAWDIVCIYVYSIVWDKLLYRVRCWYNVVVFIAAMQTVPTQEHLELKAKGNTYSKRHCFSQRYNFSTNKNVCHWNHLKEDIRSAGQAVLFHRLTCMHEHVGQPRTHTHTPTCTAHREGTVTSPD